MKISIKLTLAFLLVSLIAVGLVAAFIWGTAFSEFNRYLVNQRQGDFIVAVTAYYQAQRTWAGVDAALREQNLLPPPNEPDAPPQPFVLVGFNREVLVGSEPYLVGQKVKKGDIEKGIPIQIDGQTVGTVISTGQPLVRKPIDDKYLQQITRALWLAGIGGVLVALLLGSWMASTLARPIQEITRATRALARGRLEQPVPVRSADELGELAQSFNQMSADLTRANQSRRQMTADVAHDLRNPLTVIGGYIESMRDGSLQPTAERFDTMQAEVQQLVRLVDDLRTLSLADGGELALSRQPTAVDELLQRTATAYRLQAEQQGIRLEVTAGSDLPDYSLDPERMEQVLGNLVGNALRYTPPGGEIRLIAGQENGNLRLVVQDTGSGIPADAMPFIFERSYRGDPSRSGSESGLGLAIARSIVELHGGTIRAESQEGMGSRFILEFPSSTIA